MALKAFKTKASIEELWIVFIEDKWSRAEHQATNIPEKRSVASFYDKIFCFDFFQSKIHAIK
ncbi:hypothetical protein AQ505_10660 [Pedobacter sp. PACM 27299]|nr:hypothetical protein AQ505_10660 [Pedobacter sp. PACM 27299]